MADMESYYQSQIMQLRDNDSAVEFSAKEHEWEVERNMLMALVEK